MLVEIYAESETQTMTPDDCEGGLALVNKLGLTKQSEFYKADRPMVPWVEATPEQVFVFRECCPIEEKLADYHAGPIPVRVLEVAEKAQESGFFTDKRGLCVWRPESLSDIRRDPVLVGYRAGRTEWPPVCFILARWGDVLEEWPALLKKALASAGAKIRRVRAELDRDLAAIQNYSPSACIGPISPYYSRQFRD